jgi:hypothetical protein
MPIAGACRCRPGNGAAIGTVLVDGCYEADWRLRRSARADGQAVLNIAPSGA